MGVPTPCTGRKRGIACRGLKSQARDEISPEPGLFLESTGSLLGQGSIWGSEMIAKMAVLTDQTSLPVLVPGKADCQGPPSSFDCDETHRSPLVTATGPEPEPQFPFFTSSMIL